MWRTFRGTISGAGLERADIDVNFEETAGHPPPPRSGWFAWTGTHQFRIGDQYVVEEGGTRRSYHVAIVGTGPGQRVEFRTV